MILLFPDAAALRLVVGTDGLLPADVLLAPATASADPGGRVAVEFDAKLGKKTLAELSALGVAGSRRHLGPTHVVTCWPQLLPADKLPKLPELASAAPVLFELPAADLSTLAGEMLRLGNDRQQVLGLTGTAGERVLLRVVGPPYYTLLRAVDDPDATVRAFAEAAPRVWVRLGFAHPFAALLKPADGQMLLIGPPRDWEAVPDGPFRDIYELLDLQLPAARVDWRAVDDREKVTVPLTLAAGSGTDTPELWVLRGDRAEATLDQFVREADARLVQRLKFAVADAPDGPIIALRTTASRLAAPVLALPGAVGFRPFSKLPNLLLPAGRRLHPTLRRDAVRELLAPDPDQLVWLHPDGDKGFVPESLPEAAFRPLAEWVEYVVSRHAQPLAEWVAASTFEFEPFVCGDNDKPKPTKPADDAPKVKRPGKSSAAPPSPAAAPADQPAAFVPTPVAVTPVATPAAEWRERREKLEKAFIAVDGGLDHPDRVSLWPELAVANAGAGEPGEAAVCWLNAAWQAPDPAPLAARWLGTEFPDGPPATAEAFDAVVNAPDPTPGEARRATALILATAASTPPPTWLAARLPVAQQFLQANEGKLPVRAVWLAALRLAELGGSDALGLARVRDRLLARMLDEGLNPERDLPGFLRFAGLTDSERVRLVRAGAGGLHAEVRAWCETSLNAHSGVLAGDRTATLGYVDLLFAFGMARLGDTAAAEALATSGRRVFAALDAGSPAAVPAPWLQDAYNSRVAQAAAGKAHAGGLPADLLARLDGMRGKAVSNGQAQTDAQLVVYAIDRLRYNSRVLEPLEKLDPYRQQKQHAGKLPEALLGLEQIAEPDRLARRVRELFDAGADGKPTPATRSNVLAAALPLAHRAGEAFALETVGRVDELVTAAPPADKDGSTTYGFLLERAIFLAGFYDRREVVQRLVERFVQLTKPRAEAQRFELVNAVAVQAFRSLRRLGLRDEIDRLAGRLPELVFAGPDERLGKFAAKSPALLGAAAPAALAVAAGWQLVGLADRAAPVLADAEAVLLGPPADKVPPKDYPLVIRAYLAAVGFGPADSGLDRMRRLFVSLREPRLAPLVRNSRTSAKLFSEFHLAVAEEAVLAATGDEFALGPAGRRWLEDDEGIVRRRLHRDMGRVLERGL